MRTDEEPCRDGRQASSKLIGSRRNVRDTLQAVEGRESCWLIRNAKRFEEARLLALLES